MANKRTLVAMFVKKECVAPFIEEACKTIGISANKIYVYKIVGNDDEYICTISISSGVSNIGPYGKPMVIHIKNGSIFSINALNKLIEKEKGETSKSNNEFLIDWEMYKNKLIMLKNGELKVSDITKIDDFSKVI